MTHALHTCTRVLTHDEIKRLLTTTRDHPDERWLLVALVTGLRRGELLALRWSHVDLEQGTLFVQHTLDGTGNSVKPKTGQRAFVLPTSLIAILQKQRRSQDAGKQERGAMWHEGDLVFADASGGLLDAARLQRSLKVIAARAGVAPFLFHTLRNTTLSLLLEAGVPPAVVQAILGIHRVASPLAHLSPLSLAMLREAAAKLDTILRHLLP